MNMWPPLKVFYCYAPEDRRLRAEIAKRLAVLRNAGRIIEWYDGNIQVGMDREKEIDQHIYTADIILLLISPDFIASRYCYGQMQKTLENCKLGKTRVIPIILRPTILQDTPLKNFEMIPEGGKPISMWRDRDEALNDVQARIQEIVDSLGKLNKQILTQKLMPQKFLPPVPIDDSWLPSDEKSTSSAPLNDLGTSEIDEFLEDLEFVTNPDPRFPILLILDTSSSMKDAPITALNEGLRVFQKEVARNELVRRRMEIAIITFGNNGVQIIQHFRTIANFSPPTLKASGLRPMGEAITQALNLLIRRKGQYKANGIPYYRPWVFLITSGSPTDDWQEVFKHIREAEEKKDFKFFTIGLENVEKPVLFRLAVREAVQLEGLKFMELFLWISSALAKAFQSNAGYTDLPPLDDWVKFGDQKAWKSWLDEGI